MLMTRRYRLTALDIALRSARPSPFPPSPRVRVTREEDLVSSIAHSPEFLRIGFLQPHTQHPRLPIFIS